MADYRSARRTVFTILTVLLVIIAIALAILLSPIGRNTVAQRDEIERLETELQRKTRETLPLAGIDQKLVQAHEQIDEFYRERLPASYADAVAQLGQLASANNVRLANAGYETSAERPAPDVREITITAELTGDYVNQMKFVNAVERSRTLFVVNSVQLAEEPQGGGVRLRIALQTYVRNAA